MDPISILTNVSLDVKKNNLEMISYKTQIEDRLSKGKHKMRILKVKKLCDKIGPLRVNCKKKVFSQILLN